MSDADFESFDWRSFEENVAGLISEQWMLVTPGVPGRWNTMTASWGGFGHIWNMDVAFVFVRPSRHTYGFMEREGGFTLSFFDERWRKALDVCGSRSGRDTDKAAAAGITPRAFEVNGSAQRVAFDEARLVLACRKIHSQELDPGCFIDPSISDNYPTGDVHRLFIGAIEGAWRSASARNAKGR
jgi:flavin reductase (DIM6/NTAB) family NADH-FMN oxidoreductase RutF